MISEIRLKVVSFFHGKTVAVAGLFAVAVVTVMVGCGADQKVVDVLDPEKGRKNPVAVVDSSIQAKVKTNVSVDGSGSYDPNGKSLTYSWVLAAIPNGSSAALTSSDTSIASFYADKGGHYKVTLKVSNVTEGESDVSLSSQTVTADVDVTGTGSNHPPVAIADITEQSASGAAIVDGSASYDTDGNQLTYEWTLVTNSNSVWMENASSSIAYIYTKSSSSITVAVKLRVSDGVDYDESTTTVTLNAASSDTSTSGVVTGQ